IAAMTAALEGVDVLVFTGGVGERSAPIRARAASGLGFLGIEVDRAANAQPTLDAEVGESGATVRTFVVEAREDLQIAREGRRLLGWRFDRRGAGIGAAACRRSASSSSVGFRSRSEADRSQRRRGGSASRQPW